MPRLAEYRWLRGLRTASQSFSTAIVGDGMSGLPKPRSMTSSPARRASIFSASIVAKTYGGRALKRRNPTEHDRNKRALHTPVGLLRLDAHRNPAGRRC